MSDGETAKPSAVALTEQPSPPPLRRPHCASSLSEPSATPERGDTSASSSPPHGPPQRQKPRHYLCKVPSTSKMTKGGGSWVQHMPRRRHKERCTMCSLLVLSCLPSAMVTLPLQHHLAPKQLGTHFPATTPTYLKITTVLKMEFSAFHDLGSGLHLCYVFFISYHGLKLKYYEDPMFSLGNYVSFKSLPRPQKI